MFGNAKENCMRVNLLQHNINNKIWQHMFGNTEERKSIVFFFLMDEQLNHTAIQEKEELDINTYS